MAADPNSHALFVAAAYAVSALGVGGLIGWVLWDGHMRQKELRGLEASGVRRRSDAAPLASRGAGRP